MGRFTYDKTSNVESTINQVRYGRVDETAFRDFNSFTTNRIFRQQKVITHTLLSVLSGRCGQVAATAQKDSPDRSPLWFAPAEATTATLRLAPAC